MSTATSTREAWLAERRKGVGASEAAAVLGVSRWRTKLEVYMDKLNLLPDRQTPQMKWGLRHEPTIARAYEEETGRTLTATQLHLKHDKAPWMMATLDHLAGDRVVQLKTAGEWSAGEFGEPGTEEVPKEYFLQCQQEMACSGREVADLATLIGLSDFRIYTIRLRPAIIAELIEVERDFMDRVARQEPPLPDFTHPSTVDLLNMIEPDANEVIEMLDDDTLLAVAEYERLGKTASEATASRKWAKAKILHAMGTAGVAELPDGRILRRKLIEKDGYSVGPSSYYDLRILKGK